MKEGGKMDYIVVDANPQAFEDVMEFVFTKIKDEDNLYPSAERVIKDLRLATEEIFINIVSYAYDGIKGEVRIGAEVSDGEISIEISDKGIPFNPLEKEEPDITSGIEQRKVGGLGIYIAKRMMDETSYRRKGNENIITMKKRISLVSKVMA